MKRYKTLEKLTLELPKTFDKEVAGLRRKITRRFEEWKASGDRKKCLVVRGARQIGKTYSIEEFAKENYGHYLRIDLHKDVGARTMFDGDLDAGTIMMVISARYPRFEFVPGNTLLFLDEIQDCPNARTALKFLSRNENFDIVASGSLMGLKTKGVASMPVGSEENVQMYPMDFEEFLWAMGISEGVVEHVRGCIRRMEPLEDSLLDSMYRYMRWFMMVGGMPEAVQEFSSTRLFNGVRRIQKDLMEGYGDDIGSYAEGRYKDRVRRCLDSISSQLARDNKTFLYSDMEDNPDYAVGSKYFEYALNWLSGAELSLICDCVTQPRLPLEENAINPAFKLYLLDTGLLLSMYDDSILYDVLSGGVDVNKGALSENLVACMLHSQGRRLYYYQVSERGKERMELDFVTIIGGKATAIEVKSGKKRDTKSLNKAMEKFGIDGIMFETRNIFVDDKGVRHYPLFAASFMDCIDVKPELTVDLPDADSINERFGDRDSDRYRRPRRDILSTLPRTTLPQKARPMRITSPLIPR